MATACPDKSPHGHHEPGPPPPLSREVRGQKQWSIWELVRNYQMRQAAASSVSLEITRFSFPPYKLVTSSQQLFYGGGGGGGGGGAGNDVAIEFNWSTIQEVHQDILCGNSCFFFLFVLIYIL